MQTISEEESLRLLRDSDKGGDLYNATSETGPYIKEEDPLKSDHQDHSNNRYRGAENFVDEDEDEDEMEDTVLMAFRHRASTKVSSLDFERIVNQYSIQAVRDQWNMGALPVDGSHHGNTSTRSGGRRTHRGPKRRAPKQAAPLCDGFCPSLQVS